jgi:hypothetical protein
LESATIASWMTTRHHAHQYIVKLRSDTSR